MFSSGVVVIPSLKKQAEIVVVCVAFVVVTLAWNDYVMSRNARSRLFFEPANTPTLPVALVLGTSKYSGGRLNNYYAYRIVAAADLFHAGKIRGILVSGDNATIQYNEPTTMKKDLINLGVPTEYITQDYAGFRTLDSIYRAQKVFGIDQLVIVSQRFHCERALYLADAIGLSAVGFCVPDGEGGDGWAVRSREVFARALAYVDVNLLNRQPRFLGKKEYMLLKPS